MDFLKYKIEKARNIKANSLKAYLIAIKKLNEYMTDDEYKNLDFLKDEDKVIEYLDTTFALTTQKNYLASIIVALTAFGKKYDDEVIGYRNRLDELNEKYNSEISKNEKNEKQDKNWMSLKQLRHVLNQYKSDLTERGSFKKEVLSKKEMNILQMWVVGNLYLNDDNPPTRLDYGNMRIIKNEEYEKLKEEELKDNYLVIKSRNSKFFSFGNYKTDKTYSTQKIPLGKKLNSIINIWLKYNKNGSLLNDSKGNSMSSNQLGKYITKVFKPSGKNISVNLLRHIFISEKFPAEKEDEKEDVASKMLHSKATQGTYSKKE